MTASTGPSQDPRPSLDPSDILFLVLSVLVLLLTGLTVGGLAAHPFAG